MTVTFLNNVYESTGRYVNFTNGVITLSLAIHRQNGKTITVMGSSDLIFKKDNNCTSKTFNFAENKHILILIQFPACSK